MVFLRWKYNRFDVRDAPVSLLDTLQKPPAKNVQVHKVTKILEKVTPDERAALQTALASPDEWSASALAATLTELVSPISASSVKRYRTVVLRIKA